jgi:hypothetical protein
VRIYQLGLTFRARKSGGGALLNSMGSDCNKYSLSGEFRTVACLIPPACCSESVTTSTF